LADPPPRVVPLIPAEDWATLHEAGHVAIYLKLEWPFRDVRLYASDGEACGGLQVIPGHYPPIPRAAACLGGPIAESRYCGVPLSELAFSTCRTDFAMMRAAMLRAECWRGAALDVLIQRTEMAIFEDWSPVCRLADALLDRGRLDYDEVRQIVWGG
jgi:hypothetical protein